MLIGNFLKDPTIATAPNASPIAQPTEMFSAEFTLGELLDDPRTAPLIKKYLPNLPPIGFIRAFTLEQLQNFAASRGAVGDVTGLVQELQRIPVAPQ